VTTTVRVLVCDPVHHDGIATMEQAGFVVDVNPHITANELQTVVSTYDALVVRSRTKVTERVIRRGTQLKAVGRVGVGLDNIDLDAAAKRAIAIFNSPEASAGAVAELTIGLMIALARRIPFADQAMKAGDWAKKRLKGWQLEGKTLGVIGLGHIGERVAKLAKALGMKILITKRTPPDPRLLEELEGAFVPLRDLLTRSDIVTVHVPLTPETRHLIGRQELQAMKDSACMINAARGSIIDEDALLWALQSGKLAGAALDVYAVEPPTNFELMKLPNVVCTPHIGGQTGESQRKATTIIAEKIITHLTNS
jgi:D-3-phosphoglycerate dehydrogenase